MVAPPKALGQSPHPLSSPAKSASPAIPANSANPANLANPAVLPGQYHDSFTLADAVSPQIELHSIDRQHHIYFTLPQTHVVRTATIHLYYAFSPALIPQLSQLKLILNGTLFATIQPTAGQFGGSGGADAEADFNIPPELL